jgi:hypothetical protein
MLRRTREAAAATAVVWAALGGTAWAASITIAWDPSPDSNIVAYIIHYGTESGRYGATVEVSASTRQYTFTNLPKFVRYYFAVQARNTEGAVSVLSSEVSGFALDPPKRYTEFDGDERADIVVWRPGDGTWYIVNSSGGYSPSSARTIAWGSGSLGDVPVAGDFDGDGLSDVAVWRPGTGIWYVRTSGSFYSASGDLLIQWGSGVYDDVPVPGDYDGDGRTDPAVWRPGTGTWWVRTSSTNYTAYLSLQWGAGWLLDVPVPGDYDGDGRTDPAVWRPGSGYWYIATSSTNYAQRLSFQWGTGSLGDVPVTGDYDGDGRTDLTVWRPGEGMWYVRTSRSEYTTFGAVRWGAGWFGDVPVAEDYDGDRRTDIVVWRPSEGVWYVLTSSSDFQRYFTTRWGAGAAADVPIGVPRRR